MSDQLAIASVIIRDLVVPLPMHDAEELARERERGRCGEGQVEKGHKGVGGWIGMMKMDDVF